MDLSNLTTEKRNHVSMHIDELSTSKILEIINDEDKKVAEAVEKELPIIAKAVDEISERFTQGGRIIYCGAGTSGRLGVLDATELVPTYSVSPDQAFGIIAGGQEAMFRAIEGAEDSKELAVEDMKKINLNNKDVLISIAASGRTPYTIGAIEYGNKLGALTISVTCNQDSEMHKIANISIAPVVGPEVITGSTRMKAGTAQKLVLNMLSTATMIKIGKVYENLMINVQATNEKLVKRAVSIIMQITNLDEEKAVQLFNESEQSVAVSIIMFKTGKNFTESKILLEKANGKVYDAIKNAGKI